MGMAQVLPGPPYCGANCLTDKQKPGFDADIYYCTLSAGHDGPHEVPYFHRHFSGDTGVNCERHHNLRDPRTLTKLLEAERERVRQLEELAAAPRPRIDWHGVLLVLDEFSTDGRLVSAAGFGVRETPLPLLGLRRRGVGHDGSEVIGRIDRVWVEGGDVLGEGILLAEAYNEVFEAAQEAGGWLACGADLDDVKWADVGDRHIAVSRGRLTAATVYLNGQTKGAHPRAMIEVAG